MQYIFNTTGKRLHFLEMRYPVKVACLYPLLKENPMTKIAVIADIHGNQTALEAVVSDIKAQGIEETWCLGDLFLPGPAGNIVFDLLSEINTTVILRGNWDDVLLKITHGKEAYNLDDPSDIYMGYLAHYLSEQLTPKYFSQIKSAPIETYVTTHNINLVLTHNERQNNGGPKLLPQNDTTNFEPLFKDDSIDVAIYAHTHHQVMRYNSNDQLILNPGSIGEPFFRHPKLNQDRRAQYTILEIDDTGILDITFKKVAYNIDLEIARAKSANLPYLDLYQMLLTQGVSPTQNKELLAQRNQADGYNELFQDVLKES